MYETSSVNVVTSEATVSTRNVDHRTVMDVQEDLRVHADPNNFKK